MIAPIHANMPPSKQAKCDRSLLDSLIHKVNIPISSTNFSIALPIVGAAFLIGLALYQRESRSMGTSSPCRSAAVDRLKSYLSLTWKELSICCHRVSHLLKLAIENEQKTREQRRETGLVIERTTISPPETHSLLSDSIKNHDWSPIEKSIERRRQLRLSQKYNNQENDMLRHAPSTFAPGLKSRKESHRRGQSDEQEGHLLDRHHPIW